MEFEGRVFSVTGPASGIGRETSIHCAAQGAIVAAADLDGAGAEATAAEIRDAGGRASAHALDVGDDRQVEEMVAQVLAANGRIDGLANVAGLTLDAPFEKTTNEIWDRVMATNLRGPFFTCRAVLPVMQRQGAGAIVNVASAAAYLPQDDLTAYSASKGGLIAMTRVLAREAARHGVRANVVAPSLVDTPMLRRDGIDRAQWPVETWGIPLNRLAQPLDIAEAIAFLLSDRASFITGQVLHVNGGRIMAP